MPNSICGKKASDIGAFFYACLTLLVTSLGGVSFPALANQTCGSGQYDETVQVEKVHDGDTLRLTDGRKLRIIGVNTPELARDETPAEPWSRQARDGLRKLLGTGASIKLRWGKEKTDRYGRLLAHVFLPDGQNVSQWLLTQGYAMALTVPPNIWNWSCYARSEQQAREKRRGLWSHQRFQVGAAKQLKQTTRGFRLVQGTVERVGFSKSSIWLNLDRNFAIRIKRSDLSYFNGVDFRALQGKQLVARGWINYHKQQLRMRVRHPAALQIEEQH